MAAKVLLRAGADPWERSPTLNGTPHTPEQFARAMGRDGVARWLRSVRGFTPLMWACEERDADKCRGVLRADDTCCVGAKAPCGLTALQIAEAVPTGPHAPYPTVSPEGWLPELPVCPETAALVAGAAAPWRPGTHLSCWPHSFRRGVVTVLLVARRLASGGAAEAERSGARAVPLDCWLHVLSFCGRRDFRVGAYTRT